jgi:hypothetical protein
MKTCYFLLNAKGDRVAFRDLLSSFPEDFCIEHVEWWSEDGTLFGPVEWDQVIPLGELAPLRYSWLRGSGLFPDTPDKPARLDGRPIDFLTSFLSLPGSSPLMTPEVLRTLAAQIRQNENRLQGVEPWLGKTDAHALAVLLERLADQGWQLQRGSEQS